MGVCNGGLFIVHPAWPWFGQQLITNKYILDPGLSVVWSLSWYCVWASVSLPLEKSLSLWHAATHYAICVCARACVYLCVEMHYTQLLSLTHTELGWYCHLQTCIHKRCTQCPCSTVLLLFFLHGFDGGRKRNKIRQRESSKTAESSEPSRPPSPLFGFLFWL